MPTVEVVPDSDGFIEWSYPETGTHFDDIDEGSGGPGSDYINASQTEGDDDDVDIFEMGDPDFEGGVASQVVVWTYGNTGIDLSSPEIEVRIAGEIHGPVNLGLGVAPGWKSNTFYPIGDDWTELAATGLKIMYHANVPFTKDLNRINTCYALFTYEPYVPPDYAASNPLGVDIATVKSVMGVLIEDIKEIKGV